MPKAAVIQTAFNAGEWSPLMEGQVNLQKRAGAVSLLQNMIPLKQGPAIRRGGTRFVKEVKDSSKRTALIDFIFGKLTTGPQAYQIEAGDQYFRFYRNNAPIKATAQNITGITNANPAVLTYAGADTYANGEEIYLENIGGMTQLNGKYFKAANVNAGSNTLELQTIDGTNVNSTNYGVYTAGGTVSEVYQVSSPYTQANLYDSNNLFQLMYAQSADVLYTIHGAYKPYALTRSGHAAWNHAALILNDGPYLDVNTTATTLTLSGTTGSVTVTASAVTGINNNTGFAATDVGRLIRWKDPAGNWTWLTITAFTDTTHVTATISGANASAGTATTNWRLGVYSDTTGWPRVICFHQNRLVLAGSSSYPDRYDMSRIGGYSDTSILFAPSDANGTVTDDAAITGTLQSGQINAIQWMASTEKGLLIGTTSKEWVIRSSETNDVLTPSNQKADPADDKGGAYIKPLEAEGGVLFTQDQRRKLIMAQYSFENDRILGDDLTIFAEHITRTGILGLAYQQEPINSAWAYRADGLLLNMTFYPSQEVIGWARHPIGGDGIVESISVIPSADGTREELWLIVKRTINGHTRRYVEYMTRYYEDDMNLEDAFQVDCGLTYDSVATNAISGFDHLEGETVKVMRDGKSHPDLEVQNGTLTLANNRTGSVITAGFSAPWAIKGLQVEAGAANGTAQGKKKRWTGLVARLLNSLGMKYGPNANTLDEEDFDQGASYDETPELYNGDTKFLRMPGGYEVDGRYYLTHDGVFPACVLAVMGDVETQDR